MDTWTPANNGDALTHPGDGVEALPDHRLHVVGPVLHVDPVQQGDVEAGGVGGFVQDGPQPAAVAHRAGLPLATRRPGGAQHRVAGLLLLLLRLVLLRGGGAGPLHALSVALLRQTLQQRDPGHDGHRHPQPTGGDRDHGHGSRYKVVGRSSSHARTYFESLVLISSRSCW